MSLGWSRIAVAVGMQGRKVAWQAAVLALVLGLAGVSMADPAQVDLGRAAFGGNVESLRLVVAHEAAARDVPVDSKNESQSSTAADATACVEVARSGRWKETRGDEAGSEAQNVTQDPRDIWNFQESVLEQDIQERVIRIQNQRYVLGVWSGKPHWVFIDDYPNSGPTPPDVRARIDYEMSHPKQKKGPVYLARVGADGVATIVCEFKSTWHWWFNQYHFMTPLERDASAASGATHVPVESLFNDAMAFRDAPDCGPGESSTRLAICLPNTLKRADAAFVPARKYDLFAELNRKCDLRLTGLYTHAGWLSYVLSEQSRALCVIDALRGSHDAR